MRGPKRFVLGAFGALGFDAQRRGRDWLFTRRPQPGQKDHGFAGFVPGPHLAGVLRRLGVSCVLDVGANTGQYAQGLRRLGYTGHIVSFEPSLRAHAELCRNAEGDPRWTTHRLALGSQQGTAELQVAAASLFSSVLPRSAYSERRFRDSARVVGREPVPMERLDRILDDVTRPVQRPRLFLKLDTQGFDLEVFAGLGKRAGELLGLQSELACIPLYRGMPGMLEALATYEAHGFGVTGLFPVSRDPDSGRVIEFDCVMVKGP